MQIRDDDPDHLNTALAVGDIGVWKLNTVSGQAWRNLQHDRLFGYAEHLPEWTLTQFLGHVVPADRDRVEKEYTEALDSGAPWQFDCRITRLDGEERWIRVSGKPDIDADGRIVELVGYVIDITDTKRTEARLRLMTAELNHRVRNMLGVLQSIMRLSAKKADTVAQLEAAYLGRLAALARTHDIFANYVGTAIPLVALIEGELLPHVGGRERFSINGSLRAAVEGRNAETVSLIMHELVTNAVKHGALSNETGTISIDLRAEPASGGIIVIDWQETGGPPVQAPLRTGFGTTLFSSVLSGAGSISIEYPPEGLRARIEITAAGAEQATPPESPAPVVHAQADLKGKRIMIVEDEALIAMSLEMTLMDEGAEVIGPFAVSELALAAVDDGLDAAVLDVQLGKHTTRDVAAELFDRKIPFLFTTGHSDWQNITLDFTSAPVLDKPVREADVVAALRRLLGRRGR